MPLSTAEKNKRKRQRKQLAKQQDDSINATAATDPAFTETDSNVEVEYVAEPLFAVASAAALPEALQVLQRFNERAAVASVVTDDESNNNNNNNALNDYNFTDRGDEDDSDLKPRSKRKLRDMLRPSIAELKRHVQRPDLVEAHDVTAPDPRFLLQLKSTTGVTVPVPRHWGRKRKYLQNKRGFQKPPFQLPDFLVATGITTLRDSVADSEAGQSIRQKNRQRVAPKMGAMDVDYKVLYDAFFKHQTKPTNLTKFGDVYYEGKEMEVQQAKFKPGMPLSKALRDALNMTTPSTPPPWLWNMQRYGPPPCYPGLKVPGLNAPLPTIECQYGFHPGGWGKPPVDAYGRLIYGGNPLDPPGSSSAGNSGDGLDSNGNPLATSDGKTLPIGNWGALPMAEYAEQDNGESSEEEESNDDEMEESEDEEQQYEDDGNDVVHVINNGGVDSVLPPPPGSSGPFELRKPGDETPNTPQQLYQVVQQQAATSSGGAVFSSDVQYVIPGIQSVAAEGAASVLSKAATKKQSGKKGNEDYDDDEGMGKSFKF